MPKFVNIRLINKDVWNRAADAPLFQMISLCYELSLWLVSHIFCEIDDLFLLFQPYRPDPLG
jgi:hypothetical protein